MLAETYPDARCELDFDDPFELLVVTVLSAQTTDRRVNAVRPTLFAAYPDARAMAAAPREDLERIIGPLGFFRAKTESLLKLSAALVADHDGEVPPRLDDLVKLPGRGPQDRQRGARQRLRRPRHHRRHPLRPADPPARLDRGDRRGQGRARDRGAVPQARLDDAEPPPDLARPPGLPREEAGLRCLHGGALVPVVRRRADRPRGRRRCWSRPRGRHEAVVAVLAAVAAPAQRLLAVVRRKDGSQGRRPAARRHPRSRSAAASPSTWPTCAGRW